MLFSATMLGWVKKLANKYLNNPLTIDLVGDHEEKLAEGIKLYAISTTATSKQTILGDLVTVYAKGGKGVFPPKKMNPAERHCRKVHTVLCLETRYNLAIN